MTYSKEQAKKDVKTFYEAMQSYEKQYYPEGLPSRYFKHYVIDKDGVREIVAENNLKGIE